MNFGTVFNTAGAPAPIQVTETQQSGYQLVPVAGANAVCTDTTTGAAQQVLFGLTTVQQPFEFTLHVGAPFPRSAVRAASLASDPARANLFQGQTARQSSHP